MNGHANPRTPQPAAARLHACPIKKILTLRTARLGLLLAHTTTHATQRNAAQHVSRAALRCFALPCRRACSALLRSGGDAMRCDAARSVIGCGTILEYFGNVAHAGGGGGCGEMEPA
jgi:RNase P protein component